MSLLEPQNSQDKFMRSILIEATPAQMSYFWKLVYSKFKTTPERARYIDKIKKTYKLWDIKDILKDQISEVIKSLDEK